MKKSACLLATFLLVILLSACSRNKQPEVAAAHEPTPEQLIKKGEYLVTIMSCNDCHSPKTEAGQIIPELRLSGYPADKTLLNMESSALKKGWLLFAGDMTAATGPWGVSFSANLTSDPTGIGSWTEENFKRAMKEGKYKGMPGGRTLLPPMPWQNYSQLTDEDVSAIFAYLKSTSPVRNIVPPPVPPDQAK